jgi:hypothetical protein
LLMLRNIPTNIGKGVKNQAADNNSEMPASQRYQRDPPRDSLIPCRISVRL